MIPWQRVECVRFQGITSVIFTLDTGDRFNVSVRGGERGRRLAARLKARRTALVNDDPLVCYEPKRESVRAFLWGYSIFGGLLMACALYLSVTQTQRFGPLPWSAFRWIAFVFANFHSWLVIITLWLFWRMRPRSPQFHRVAISEVGLRMEGDEAPPVDIGWTEVAASKRVAGDPLRFRLDLVEGRRVWLVVPKRVRQDVLRRMPVTLGGVAAGPPESHRGRFGLPIRLLAMGLAGAGGYLGFLFWLLNAGLLVQSDFKRMAAAGVAMFMFMTWYPGLMLLWARWRSTPRGRRTVRRWSRRVCARRAIRPA